MEGDKRSVDKEGDKNLRSETEESKKAPHKRSKRVEEKGEVGQPVGDDDLLERRAVEELERDARDFSVHGSIRKSRTNQRFVANLMLNTVGSNKRMESKRNSSRMLHDKQSSEKRAKTLRKTVSEDLRNNEYSEITSEKQSSSRYKS